MNALKWQAVYQIGKIAYAHILRELLVKAVESTENDLDEMNLYYRALAENFEFEEEDYIDDIPFNIAPALHSKKLSYYAVSR